MRHPNIVELIEIAVAKGIHHFSFQLVDCLDSATDQRFKLHYVFPYIDHDLAGILVNHRIQLTVPMIKCYFQQMLEGIFYLHANRILHRDIKRTSYHAIKKIFLGISCKFTHWTRRYLEDCRFWSS